MQRNIESLFRTCLFTNALTFVCLFLGVMIIALNFRDTSRLHENSLYSHKLSNELIQSSDDLTRMARTYVVTDDPKYEEKYWEILGIRNGELPRPDDTKSILLTSSGMKGEAQFFAKSRF